MSDKSIPDMMEIFRRLERLTDTISGLSKDILYSRQNVNLNLDFEKILRGAPSSVWFGTLRRLLETRLLRQQDKSKVSRHLSDYNLQRQRLNHSLKRAKELNDRYRKLKAQVSARGYTGGLARYMVRRSAQSSGLLGHRAAIARRIRQQRSGMRQSLSGGRAAAIAGLAAGRRGMNLASAFSKLSIITSLVSESFKTLVAIVKMGQGVIGQYWRYSAGGLSAMVTQTVGDFRRNINISTKIADDMEAYARATTRMKDAFAPAFSEVYKFILKAGTRIAEGIADAIEPATEEQKKKVADIQAKKRAINTKIGAADAQRVQRGLAPLDPDIAKQIDELRKAEKELEDDVKKQRNEGLGKKQVDWWHDLPVFGLHPDEQAKRMAKGYKKRLFDWPGHMTGMAPGNRIPGVPGVPGGRPRIPAFPGRGPGAPVAPGERGGGGAPPTPQERQKQIEEQMKTIAPAYQAMIDQLNAMAKQGKIPDRILKQFDKLSDKYWRLKREWDRLQKQIVPPAGPGVPGGAKANNVFGPNVMLYPFPEFFHDEVKPRRALAGDPRGIV